MYTFSLKNSRIRNEDLRKQLGTEDAINYIKTTNKVAWTCYKTKRIKNSGIELVHANVV
jgi:hypothetical protein